MCDKEEALLLGRMQSVEKNPQVELLHDVEEIWLQDSSSSEVSVEMIIETVPHNSAAIKEEEVPVPISFDCIKDEPEEETANGQENGMLQCSVCCEEFINNQNLKIHERKHRADSTFKCKRCKVTFHNSSSLNLHLYLTAECSNNVEHI
jgi:hypothetical protein